LFEIRGPHRCCHAESHLRYERCNNGAAFAGGKSHLHIEFCINGTALLMAA
jgi:hypothetical protein